MTALRRLAIVLDVDVRDLVFALLAAPLVLVGLWAGVALLFAVAA